MFFYVKLQNVVHRHIHGLPVKKLNIQLWSTGCKASQPLATFSSKARNWLNFRLVQYDFAEKHTRLFSDKALMVLPLSSRLLKTFWKLKTDQVHRVTCIRAPPSGATENDASGDWTPSHDEEQQRYMTAYSTLFTRHTLRSWVSIFRSLFLQIYLAVP